MSQSKNSLNQSKEFTVKFSNLNLGDSNMNRWKKGNIFLIFFTFEFSIFWQESQKFQFCKNKIYCWVKTFFRTESSWKAHCLNFDRIMQERITTTFKNLVLVRKIWFNLHHPSLNICFSPPKEMTLFTLPYKIHEMWCRL